MSLTKRSKPFIIPEYSLTGDLFSYLSCGLQYRYHNKGALPPSTPVQLWFGQFIHSVMEESYLEWRDKDKRDFPWEWKSVIREIELEIYTRLSAQGLSAPLNLFCPYDGTKTTKGLCKDPNHPHKLIASRRAEAALNTWGPHLFPLIDEAEIKLKGTRPLSKDLEKIARSQYYGVKGIVDVISSVSMQNIPENNLIIDYLLQTEDLIKYIRDLDSYEYEIIIDYKGMARPSIEDDSWKHHAWQILTYAWLRSKQPNSKKVIAGIIFYINELEPSGENLLELKEQIKNNSTDIMPQGTDAVAIDKWKYGQKAPLISDSLKKERSIRIITVTPEKISYALHKFDEIVGEIEMCVYMESSGRGITSSWRNNPIERNCTVCDFKTFCPNPSPHKYTPTVP
jgi:CRISPR/Cas system-associated exonuclease Cas4 (RecB family)